MGDGSLIVIGGAFDEGDDYVVALNDDDGGVHLLGTSHDGSGGLTVVMDPGLDLDVADIPSGGYSMEVRHADGGEAGMLHSDPTFIYVLRKQ